MTHGGLRNSIFAVAIAAFLTAIPSPAASTATNNFRVSIGSTGDQGNGRSVLKAITGDGRFALFLSAATNLVPGDSNGAADLFIRDRAAGTTVRADLTGTRGQIERGVTDSAAALAADGTRVAFESQSTILAPGDNDADNDVFVHDLLSGATTLVSVAPDGSSGARITPAGRRLPAQSGWPDLSADGRFVAFVSDASNLFSVDPANQFFAGFQLYIRDLATGQTSLASKNSSGEPANCGCNGANVEQGRLSADGRFLAFQSAAVNLVPGDTNGTADVFVWDRLTHVTERVSVSSTGAQANREEISESPAISPDGRFVAFTSNSTTLVEGDTNGFGDVFLRDRLTGRTERVSLTNRGDESRYGGSFAPSVSADGRFVSFTSSANDLVDNDSWPLCCDVFLRDRVKGTTERISIPTGGGTPARGSGTSGARTLSLDGRIVGLSSEVPLGPGDTNGISDAYVHDRTISARPTPVKGGAPVTLSLAKRGRRVVAKGSAALCCGSHLTGAVAVRIFVYRKSAGKFVVVARRADALDEAAGYSVTFLRPKGRRCKASAHFLGNDFYAGGTTIKRFRC